MCVSVPDCIFAHTSLFWYKCLVTHAEGTKMTVCLSVYSVYAAFECIFELRVRGSYFYSKLYVNTLCLALLDIRDLVLARNFVVVLLTVSQREKKEEEGSHCDE